jgi:hypothetical protein
VIPVRVTDQKNPGIGELESEFFDTRLDQRHVGIEIAVDKDVALRGCDQIVRQPLASDVVKVAGNAKWGERFGPVGRVCFGEGDPDSRQGKDLQPQNDAKVWTHQ